MSREMPRVWVYKNQDTWKNSDMLRVRLAPGHDGVEYIATSEVLKIIGEWRDLIELNHRTIIKDNGYTNPQEASREYRNQDNLLGALEASFKKSRARPVEKE